MSNLIDDELNIEDAEVLQLIERIDWMNVPYSEAKSNSSKMSFYRDSVDAMLRTNSNFVENTYLLFLMAFLAVIVYVLGGTSSMVVASITFIYAVYMLFSFMRIKIMKQVVYTSSEELKNHLRDIERQNPIDGFR